MAHYDFIKFVANIFNRSFENICAIVGENCITNIALTKMINEEYLQCVDIGCANLRFDLIGTDIIKTCNKMIGKVNTLKTKLQNLLPATNLRRPTHLKARTAKKVVGALPLS